MAAHNVVFVAGASPQIITETISALLERGVIVGDIHVLTTQTGRRAIEDAFWGQAKQWKRFRDRYPKARRCRFSRKNVRVLRDSAAGPLNDVRSPEDNLAAADQIADFVRLLTAAEKAPLHASIAGGRKTMGYLLAAAMMLYGRREDRMSHVLVHPAELEGTDFFFPPRSRRGCARHRKADGAVVRVPAGEVRIELAELAFPRLRVLRDMGRARDLHFSELVDELQAALDNIARPRLRIWSKESLVLCGEREIYLTPLQLAIYEELAQRRRSGCGRQECAGCPRCFFPAQEIETSLRAALRDRLGKRGSMAVDIRLSGRPWGRKNFLPEVAKINKKLERELHAGSEPYEIKSVRGRRMYGVCLSPSQIEIL